MLGLMARAERVPYKAFNTLTYWPKESMRERRRLLVEEWRTILRRVGQIAGLPEMPLPEHPENWKFRRLKRFENAIDALACAWMAAEYVDGRARRIGNALAAIWIPQSALRYAKPMSR
jgi:hypothetical protein